MYIEDLRGREREEHIKKIIYLIVVSHVYFNMLRCRQLFNRGSNKSKKGFVPRGRLRFAKRCIKMLKGAEKKERLERKLRI
tara:strand:- start:176 stop:418 length:243 start_codon:yes stop_codon:yes gene_type:complete